jgi:hypothetical protein
VFFETLDLDAKATKPEAMSRGGSNPPPDFYIDVKDFKKLVYSLDKPTSRPTHLYFVNRPYRIPKINPPCVSAHCKALEFIGKGLIGQFTGLWPSPCQIESWLSRNWVPLIRGEVNHLFCGKSYYTFFFEFKEDKDLIFRSGPYFYGTR